jgi:fibronectin-binding autotransporter adhesin
VIHRIWGSCAVLLLYDIGLSPSASAQNATWNGVTSNFNTPGNWSPTTAIPTGTAFFGATGLADITFSGPAAIGSFAFNSGAQAFTFGTTTETAGVILSGAGIVNNSPHDPTFRVSNGGIVASNPGLGFTNAASAGNAIITNTDGGVTAFLGTSTGGDATIVNSGGTAFFSGTVFIGSATAGNAVITNDTGGITQFNESTSAGNATFVNNGGNLASFSIARFINALTIPGAAPTANDAGVTAFVGTSTAGAATIINNRGGVTAFLGASTAGSAAIVTNAGGATFFTGASSGGAASLIVNAGGMLDLSAHGLGSMPAGSLTLAAGSSYQIGVTAAGQSNALGLSSAATLQGGTVLVAPTPGNYWRNPTYTIINAAGGVNGTLAGISSFAFLTPTLSYDANNVYLTLSQSFAGGGQTANQRSVGSALDQSASSTSGDFGTVISALAGLSTQQGPYALNQISGQPYADFGSFNVANNALFMNALGQQMALARGGRGSGQRQALAEACDGTSPFSVWGSVLGGVGSVQGDGNSSTFTYNVGGAAAGIDYRLSPSFLVGLGIGYTNGTQWVDSFQGKGWSNTVSVAAYGSFTQWGLYVDALAGYAYSNNQLQRQISIPSLQPRTANGSTGANQFLAQVEAGYAFGLYAPAAATVTPFARFQTSSINQAAFSEWGANSLSLNVQQQTTTSVRTVLGAELAGAIGLGSTRTLDLGLRLGWLHEYANTARPLTAAFAGAPAASFTVYGATPQRDAAVIGFQASTNIAAATQLYLRYDGDIGSGTDNHALNLGVRLSW